MVNATNLGASVGGGGAIADASVGNANIALVRSSPPY
jgi:hypothetical protein